jgi:hypothetical protein
MVVENVRGAIPWVGRSRWNFGSFHLWGDVPALMPSTSRATILKPQPYQRRHRTGSFDGSGRSFQSAANGYKSAGLDWSNRELRGQDFTGVAGKQSGAIGRKAASAMIAKIPLPLAQHIAAVYRP